MNAPPAEFWFGVQNSARLMLKNGASNPDAVGVSVLRELPLRALADLPSNG